MKKAILFDLDGTLLNTSQDIRNTLNQSLTLFGLPQVSLEDTIKFVGDGAKNLIIRAVGDKKEYVERVYGDYIVRFAACGNRNTTLYEGESDFLTRARSYGLKFAVVTNKPQNATEVVCEQYLSPFGFDHILGMSGAFPLKPDPAGCNYVIDQLGVKKSDCLFVGDGETDVLTAKNAGVDCVSALWGYRSQSHLASFGAKIFANNYAELARIVFES